MQKKADQLSKGINKINEWVVGWLMALLVLDVWVGVLDRYFFHWQLAWVEELARYIMIWAILLAIPCAMAHRAHIGLEILISRIPRQSQRIVMIFTSLVTLAFFGYIAYAGQTFMVKGFSQMSGIVNVPMALPYAAIPIAFGLAAVQSLLLLVRDFDQYYEPKEIA